MVVAGVVARGYALSRRGSLWQDEATLALNILGRSYGALLAPLDWAQTAPPLYLWLVRATATTLGAQEWTLRLWPFLAGAALLPLVWWVARRTAGEWAGAMAVSAAAGSQFAIRFATEAKPYSIDAAVAAALLWRALVVRDEPANARAWWWLAVAGLVAPGISVPSVFVLASIVVALALDPGLRGEVVARRRLAGAAATWVTSFGVLYLLVYRASATSAYLRDYWSPIMLDPRAPNLFLRLQWRMLELTWYPLRMTKPVLGLVVGVVLWLGGLALVARRSRVSACLLGGPPLLALAAAVFARYPLCERLALFLAPGVWTAEAIAVGWVVGRAGAGARWLLRRRTVRSESRATEPAPRGFASSPAVACFLLAALTLQDAWSALPSPGPYDPPRGLLETVRERAERDHAPIYVHARAGAAWIYATTDWRFPDLGRIARYRALSGAVDAPAFENLARERAVSPGEGDPLIFRTGGRVELLGLASGIRHRAFGRPDTFEPSPGWAAEEARRMLAAANPEVWLVASHFFKGSRTDELVPLLAATREAGLEVVEEVEGGQDATALRLRKRGYAHDPFEGPAAVSRLPERHGEPRACHEAA